MTISHLSNLTIDNNSQGGYNILRTRKSLKKSLNMEKITK